MDSWHVYYDPSDLSAEDLAASEAEFDRASVEWLASHVDNSDDYDAWQTVRLGAKS